MPSSSSEFWFTLTGSSQVLQFERGGIDDPPTLAAGDSNHRSLGSSEVRRRPACASANFHIQSVIAARGGAAHLLATLYDSRGRFSSGRNVLCSRAIHEFFGAFNFL
jgi:hypothetical protein